MSSTTHTYKVKKVKKSDIKPTLNYGEWNGNVFAVSDNEYGWQTEKARRDIGPGSWKHPGRPSENGFIDPKKQKENDQKNRKLNNKSATPINKRR